VRSAGSHHAHQPRPSPGAVHAPRRGVAGYTRCTRQRQRRAPRRHASVRPRTAAGNVRAAGRPLACGADDSRAPTTVVEFGSSELVALGVDARTGARRYASARLARMTLTAQRSRRPPSRANPRGRLRTASPLWSARTTGAQSGREQPRRCLGHTATAASAARPASDAGAVDHQRTRLPCSWRSQGPRSADQARPAPRESGVARNDRLERSPRPPEE